MTRLVVVTVLACACVVAANVEAAQSSSEEGLVAEWHLGGKGE